MFGKLSVLSVLCYTAQCFINLSCRFPEVWRTSVIDRSVYLGCVSLGNSKIGFLDPKESENSFRVSFPNRSIQDLSDHGASKELKNSLKSEFFSFFNTPRSERSWIDLFSKETVAKSDFGFFRFQEFNLGIS